MPESHESQKNLAYIRTHVDNLERMVRFQIASNPNSKTTIYEHLKARAGSAEFYLALADGPKTQEELTAGLGLSQSNISKIGSHLFDGGIIVRVPGRGGSRTAYMWSDLEHMLGVSKIAKKIVGESAKDAARPARKRASAVQAGGQVEPVEPSGDGQTA